MGGTHTTQRIESASSKWDYSEQVRRSHKVLRASSQQGERMATLHFIRRGMTVARRRELLSFPVDLKRVVDVLPNLKLLFPDTQQKRPLDAPHLAKSVEGYRYVFIEVEATELHPPFHTPGVYILNMSPLEVKTKLGLGT